jgi:hypothetical protein
MGGVGVIRGARVEQSPKVGLLALEVFSKQSREGGRDEAMLLLRPGVDLNEALQRALIGRTRLKETEQIGGKTCIEEGKTWDSNLFGTWTKRMLQLTFK